MGGASLWLIPYCISKHKDENAKKEDIENINEQSGGLSLHQNQSLAHGEHLNEKKLC